MLWYEKAVEIKQSNPQFTNREILNALASEGYTTNIATLCEEINAINLWHGGDLYIKAGLQEYHWKVRHKYKFESSLNLENSMRRIMEIQGPCDVACAAHLHNPYYMERHLMGEHRILMRSGSYKIWDEFGQKIAGYKRQGWRSLRNTVS